VKASRGYFAAFTAWLLVLVELLYLRVHGWVRHGDRYLSPDDYEFRRHEFYVHGHAVNAQKQRRYT
jgi:hypothetical protein